MRTCEAFARVIVLQCSDAYLELALLFRRDGPPQLTTRETHPLFPPTSFQGMYCKSIAGSPLYFFRDGETLYIRRGDGLAIALPEDVATEHSVGASGERRLVLRQGGRDLLALVYPESDVKEWRPTAFLDDEDLDFGLFIHNVLVDATRREKIWRTSGVNLPTRE
jgi:hypothetical protein